MVIATLSDAGSGVAVSPSGVSLRHENNIVNPETFSESGYSEVDKYLRETKEGQKEMEAETLVWKNKLKEKITHEDVKKTFKQIKEELNVKEQD